MRILVTGGTVFVSRCIAEYFVRKGNEVYVLNRNTHPQVAGSHLIKADRNFLGEKLKNLAFDVIVDVTAYTEKDIVNLLDSGVKFHEYFLISSGAVYPEYGIQPFEEMSERAANLFWGEYGINKIASEKALQVRVPKAYIIRPSYLYGPYNVLYREGFVFDCAIKHRKFYLPGDGSMKMQLFYVYDLCKFIEELLRQKPIHRIFNVGNETSISIKEWVCLCYKAVGEQEEYVQVAENIPQPMYFPFPDFEFRLDVRRQKEVMHDTHDIYDGLYQAYEWYRRHSTEVRKKNYIEFIDKKINNTIKGV